MPPPEPEPFVPLPFVIVMPLIVRLAPLSSENTREELLPEMSRLAAPVELVIKNAPAVVVELTTSSLVRVIVQTPAVQFGLPAGIEKLIVSLLATAFAALIASRKLQSTPETQAVLRSSVRVTVKVNCACALWAAANKQIKNTKAAVIKPEARNDVDVGNKPQNLFVKSNINF